MRVVAGLCLLCLILIAGCSEKDKIPSGVIGKEEMEKVMWDMMLADQYSANYLAKDSSKINVKLETLKLYEEVFRLHHISKDEFSKSYAFYQSRPDIARVLFDSLMARGTRARMENYTRPPGQGATQPPAATPSANPRGNLLSRPVKPAGNNPARPGSNSSVRPINNNPAGPNSNNSARPIGNSPAGPINNGPANPGANKPVNPNGQPGVFLSRPGMPPPGSHSFLGREGRLLKAGEVPFKQARKDSVPKGRQ